MASLLGQLKAQVATVTQGGIPTSRENLEKRVETAKAAVKEEAAKQAAAAQGKLENIGATEVLKQTGVSTSQLDALKVITGTEQGGLGKFSMGLGEKLKAAAGSVSAISPMTWIITGVVAAVLVGLVFLGRWLLSTYRGSIQKSEAGEKAATNAAALNAQVANAGTREGFQAAGAAAASPPVRDQDLTLLNTQPMTIKQAGFLGPAPTGEFKPDMAVSQALRAGFRAFVLEIDFLDTQRDPEKFAAPGLPTLIYRDNQGALASANSGSIRKVAETIAGLAFQPDVPNSLDPILLYLHVRRAPSPVRQQEGYLLYLSRIAKELEALIPMHLGMTPLGIFHRQKQEEVLLTAPLSSFKGQVIVMSNADTSMFRGLTGRKRFAPKEDLDYWVNLRVYLDTDSDVIGITKIPDPGHTAAAVVVYFNQIMALSAAKTEAFAVRGKSRFVIALHDPEVNPTPGRLNKALNELGVNIVPLDIFTDSTEAVKSMVEDYESKSYRPKPAALRKIAAS